MTMDLTEEIKVTTEGLLQISELAQEQVQIENDIDEITRSLKVLKKKLLKISADMLPEAMANCGLKDFTLDTGQSVFIKEGISMSAPKAEDKKLACNAWLVENEQGALIKSEIVLMYDKGERDKFLAAKALLVDNGIEEFKITEGFNTATVKAVLKELAEQGIDVPFELFGAYKYKQAEIKT